MGSKTTPFCHEPTEALRTRDGQRLAAELGRIIAAVDRPGDIDDREVMMGLAPYYDCAERLGIDPIALFDAASHSASAEMRGIITNFARRPDITLKAFGWRLLDQPEGPCYRPAERWLIWQSPSADRRRKDTRDIR